MSPQVARGPNDAEHSGQGYGEGLALGAPLFTEIDHIAIAVHDLNAAIDYYRDVFGATVEHREIVHHDGVEEALLKVAESYIQLVTPTTDESPIAKSLEKRGEGLHHVA